MTAWADGGRINTECTICGQNYIALWGATVAGNLMTVTASDGRTAAFSLVGSGDALGNFACRPDDGSDLLVSSMEKQVLWRKLRHKNAIRRELGIRQFHVPTVFKRKLRLTETHRYIQLLEPYLTAAFEAAEWPVGFTPRLLLAVKLHKSAVAQLQRDHGIADPRTKNPDILAMIDKFAPSPDNVTIIGNHQVG